MSRKLLPDDREGASQTVLWHIPSPISTLGRPWAIRWCGRQCGARPEVGANHSPGCTPQPRLQNSCVGDESRGRRADVVLGSGNRLSLLQHRSHPQPDHPTSHPAAATSPPAHQPIDKLPRRAGHWSLNAAAPHPGFGRSDHPRRGVPP